MRNTVSSEVTQAFIFSNSDVNIMRLTIPVDIETPFFYSPRRNVADYRNIFIERIVQDKVVQIFLLLHSSCPWRRISFSISDTFLFIITKIFFPEKKYYLYSIITQREGVCLSLQQMPFIID